ncbi:MAG: PVC-type heme-binding CxxCH protein [Planctomycetaceae bacterium]
MKSWGVIALWMAFVLTTSNLFSADPPPLVVKPGDELLFTPLGFDKPGLPAVAKGEQTGRVRVRICDDATGEPTPCRVNVVGSDGQYYRPEKNHLAQYGFTGYWPEKPHRANRMEKAPIRYYGWFFYSTGEAEVIVPAGETRIEVLKGFEFAPVTHTITIEAGAAQDVELTLERTLAAAPFGYYSGDPHLHITRETEDDETLIFDLLEAEDVEYGSILAYNEPAGPYFGFMNRMDMPQLRGFGKTSLASRNNYVIMSGQEYRSGTYGHLNLFGRDELVLPGENINADNWPLYGEIGRQTQRDGGFAMYAHGGYSQAIYADFVQRNVNGVELLQFGEYRMIGLEDWYNILNIGYRFPASGASDYPACRAFGDCRTYVYSDERPTMNEWLKGHAEGRSFMTTGPLLLLTVNDQHPGSTIEHQGKGAKTVRVKICVRSEVAPIEKLQLIVNGKVHQEWNIAAADRQGTWTEQVLDVELTAAAWIAARAYSTSPDGRPDADAHTNPVYVYRNGKMPYRQASLDAIVVKLDGQIARHQQRDFPEKTKVVNYFQQSREQLQKIREKEGLSHEEWSQFTLADEDDDKEHSENDAIKIDISKKTHTDEELKAFLKPIPAKPPQEALKTFETLPGFHMELVAHEPLVVDPIAAAFDEWGNLYVAEMRDYPYFPSEGKKPLGTVRLLSDVDGDGTFDEGHVFAEELLWAAGIAPWKGGVFVAASPDIWYLKDTDGDFKADVRRKIFTGFGTQNQQGMLNNLVYGLDHQVYGSTSVNGGTIQHVEHPEIPPMNLTGRDFRFDPVTERLSSISGTVQFGNTFDDWGNRFTCSESQPLLHIVLPQEYLERNPYFPVPYAIHNIAGGNVPIFRISPLERWREIRSARRITHGERAATSAGASHHVADAAAGVTIYRGGAYPPEFYGNVFVGDAQNNLIHRRVLTPNGVTFDSRRVDENTEFVRSTDNWFRPVNFVNAPDGTLYTLDMSREILEAIHIPLDVVKHLNLKSGRDNGRIYRIAPDGFKYPGPPTLGNATTRELIAALESPHGWYRETAHRLLYERQDAAAVAPLRKMLHESTSPQARLHALWSIHGLGSLEEADVIRGLNDDIPEIREHGLHLAEPFLDRSPKVLARTVELLGDPHPRIRFQLAFSLGASKAPAAVAGLAQLAKRDDLDQWTRTAVMSSVAGIAGDLFVELMRDETFWQTPAGVAMLDQLAQVIGIRHQPEEVDRVLNALADHQASTDNVAFRQNLVLTLGEGMLRSLEYYSLAEVPTTSAEKMLVEIFASNRMLAENAEQPDEARIYALRLLSCFSYDRAETILKGLIEPTNAPAVRQQAILSLTGYAQDETGPFLLERWGEFPPELQTLLIEKLSSRESWTLALLTAIEEERIPAAIIEPVRRALWTGHRLSEIANRAKSLFGNDSNNPRKEVIAAYQDALQLKGESKNGGLLFEKNCSACHKIGEKGIDIGPNLVSSPNREPAAILLHILDPNNFVLPKYMQYVIVDMQGRSYAGMIAAETATSVTIRKDKQMDQTLLRTEIDEMVNTGKSLMPEGIEKQINVKEMSDLLGYLVSVQSSGEKPAIPPKLDVGTNPGLVEPDEE